MTEMLLDTALFHDYRRGDPGARRVIERIVEGEVTASVSSVTVFELWGRPGLDRTAEIGYVGLLSFLEEAPLSGAAAKRAGIWVADVAPEERAGLARFALLAATAAERGEPVCTRDAERFGRFRAELVDY